MIINIFKNILKADNLLKNPEHPQDAVFFQNGVGYREVFFLLFQAAASIESSLPGPDVQDAWPPVE